MDLLLHNIQPVATIISKNEFVVYYLAFLSFPLRYLPLNSLFSNNEMVRALLNQNEYQAAVQDLPSNIIRSITVVDHFC